MSTAGGSLDLKSMARLHFHVLTQDQQIQAIRRLASAGQSEHTISHATGWGVEAIRHVLAEPVSP